MKRDMDLVRELLLLTEQHTSASAMRMPEIDGRETDEVYCHVKLLQGAGLIDGEDASTRGSHDYLIKDLTWAGHDFLDNARDDTRWDRAKGVMSKAGGFSFDVLKSALAQLAAEAMKRAIAP